MTPPDRSPTPGCGRWFVFALVWVVAGAGIATVVDLVVAIGEPGARADGGASALGGALGLLCGLVGGAFCGIAPFPGDSAVARLLWPLLAVIAGSVGLSVVVAGRDEVLATSALFAVAFPACIALLAGAGLYDADRGVKWSVHRPVTGVAAAATLVACVLGIGGELAAGTDVDLRTGTTDGVEWVAIDAGYHFRQAVRFDGGVIAVAAGRDGSLRWYLHARAWRQIDPPPFDATARVVAQSSDVELVSFGGDVVATRVATGEVMRTADGERWERVVGDDETGPAGTRTGAAGQSGGADVPTVDLVVAGRKVGLDFWLEPDGPSPLAFVSVPPRSSGFYCCG